MSIDFSQRCTLPELMDDPHLSAEALQGTLKAISACNKWLGGNAITIRALKRFFKQYPDKKDWIIADVGCGDGEMLRLIADAFKKKGLNIKLVGIDISEQGIALGKKASVAYPNIHFECTDVLILNKDTFACDIILCTLTLHHLDSITIVAFLRQFVQLARMGVLINDLQRSVLSYRLFKLISSIFIKSPVAKYDGLISIRSGFKRHDFLNFSKTMALQNHRILWKWAFRYLWVIKTI